MDIIQAGHGLSVGNVVRLSGTSYIKAQANTEANAEAVGIVSAVADTDNFTLCVGGLIDTLSGLTAGSVYYLDDDTAGLLTTTEPTDVGDVSKPLLIASTTTSGWIFNMRGFIVPSGTGGGSDWDATIVKQTDENVAGSTTLQNDDELVFSILANTTYFYELLIVVTSTASAADFKCDFALSAGSVLNAWRQHVGLGPTTQAIQAGQVADITTLIVFATGTSTTNAPAHRIMGMIRGDTNATFSLRWAQNTSDVANVTVKAGSFIRYRALTP